MATLYGRGQLPLNEEFTNESIIGTRFKGKLIREVKVDGFVGADPVITGNAYITGIQQFVSDPADSIKYGFVLGTIASSADSD
jgi:proline racemase/trans-L-3-hydroxyproline dehydratase